MTRPLAAALTAAALAGAATGLRSFTGLSALALTAPGPGDHRVEPLLARRPVRIAIAAAGAGELVGDKLPMAPSRLKPAGLVPRLVLGAATGWLAARRAAPGRTTAPDAAALAVLTGTTAAAAAAWAGSRWRALPAVRRRALIGALLEDAVAVGLGARGAGRARV